MSIEFRCHNCGRMLRVPKTTAGLSAQCPACGGQMPIPLEPNAPPPNFSTMPPGEPRPGDDSGRFDLFQHSTAPTGAEHADAAEIPTLRPDEVFQGPRPPSGSKALTSIGLGFLASFLSLFGCCCGPPVLFVTIPMSIAGCVYGVKALRSENQGLATLGIAVSGVALVLSLFAVIALSFFVRLNRGH
jgi:hypothetical protein